MLNRFKPYKDKRFCIAVLDYGEYSYRENKSCLTPDELKSFLKKHDLFCDESFKFAAWDEIKSLQLKLSTLEAQNEVLREAVEFYGNMDSWCRAALFCACFIEEDFGDIHGEDTARKIYYTIAGKRARAALKKCDEMNKKEGLK